MHNPIDQLINFVAERDAPFPDRIKGAGLAEIARLEAAVGRPLPAIYRQFLERMGRSTDWLRFAAARFDIDTMIRYHEFALLPDPPGFLLIGRAQSDPFYDVYLWQDTPQTLRVVSFPPPPPHDTERFFRDTMWRMAGSLPQMLGDAAGAVFANHRLVCQQQIESAAQPGRPPRLGQVDAVLAAQGIAPLWYANDWMRTYEAPGLRVNALEDLAGGRLIIDVRAAERGQFDRLLVPLRDVVKGAARGG